MEHGQAVGRGAPGPARLVVGIGCASGAHALEIVALVSACLEERIASVMAVPASRARLAAVAEAAAMLGLALAAVGDDAIEAVQERCLTRPCRAVRAVAEGAALAAGGDGAVLLGPRRKGKRVTCALAAVP